MKLRCNVTWVTLAGSVTIDSQDSVEKLPVASSKWSRQKLSALNFEGNLFFPKIYKRALLCESVRAMRGADSVRGLAPCEKTRWSDVSLKNLQSEIKGLWAPVIQEGIGRQLETLDGAVATRAVRRERTNLWFARHLKGTKWREPYIKILYWACLDLLKSVYGSFGNKFLSHLRSLGLLALTRLPFRFANFYSKFASLQQSCSHGGTLMLSPPYKIRIAKTRPFLPTNITEWARTFALSGVLRNFNYYLVYVSRHFVPTQLLHL